MEGFPSMLCNKFKLVLTQNPRLLQYPTKIQMLNVLKNIFHTFNYETNLQHWIPETIQLYERCYVKSHS